ncbi:MAG TPA: TonB-dependent receptor [Sphingomonas sp.]|uniref:TonB-dependent receptor domain-containing protein n=1 Tax=Sphingomonas sp. TaxID=28214 RepID=UPI002C565F89|nr:TonB-dependent receptor [Sphingomonas sp.]HMI20016.1 TonB-dependent receptor [Sphingomonas sp.]
MSQGNIETFLHRSKQHLRSTSAMRFAPAMIGAAMLAASVPAFAAAPDAPAAGAATPDDANAEIVITGTQISRAGFVSPTPVTSVTVTDIQKVGSINIADALNQIPALKSSVTPSSVGNLSKLAGGNYLDLRGLGYLRTLTLVDGKRYVPSSPEGVINTNMLPQAIISGVDVVTGGASAAYGSDAVAGVVNFKIDNKLQGFRGNVQGGMTDFHDNKNYLASLAYGTNFADGRGHILLGAEYAENKGVTDASKRKYLGNKGLIVNPAFGVTAGAPFLIYANDIRAAYASEGGLIDSGSLRGTKFDVGGGTSPFQYGTNLTDDNTMDGGDGDPLASTYVLVTPTKRYSGYAGATYEVASNITAYASFDYAHSAFNERSIPSDDTFTIQADNAYLPASVRTALAAAGETSFALGRGSEDYGVGRIVQRAHTWQATAGIKGSLGGSWTFDASYDYGKSRMLTLFTGDVIKSKRLLAIDAVAGPGGTIVCRSTLTDPSNGCVPLNLFGEGSPSQAAINYITGTSVRDWQQKQQVGDITVRGEPFSLWAGPISVAVGAEWRRFDVDVTSDPLSATPNVSLLRVGNVKPYSAEEEVKEAFGEVVIPLAKDQSWAKNIDVDIAGRVTDYKTSGTVETWKAGINYAVDDSIRFRATRSRDIRAPNINELFAAGQTLIGGITDSKAPAGTSQTYSVSQTTGGNPFLKPEKADTFTGGVVFTPTFIPRLSLSVDYYDIKVKGAISSLGAQTLVNRCNGGDAATCLLTPRGADGKISGILLAPINFQQLVMNGIDVEVAYRFPLATGSIDLHGLLGYINKLNQVGQDGAVTKFAGNTDQPALDGPGGTPHWKMNGSATYTTDGYKISFTERYVGGGAVTEDTVDGGPIVAHNHVSGRFYSDLYGEITLATTSRGKVALFGVVQNLFDRHPPFTGYEFQTARQLYDVVGRDYTAGIRFEF